VSSCLIGSLPGGRETSGAKPASFGIPSGTAEAVPFPKPLRAARPNKSFARLMLPSADKAAISFCTTYGG